MASPQWLQDFDLFWENYPRKVGKGAARKVWERIKPDAELVEAMLETLRWQCETAQWRGERGKYIPHPVTWLRQERWSDSPPANFYYQPAEHWTDECKRMHQGRCSNRTFHEATMEHGPR